jgi:DNA-binding HxlR family transcriptional regulator
MLMSQYCAADYESDTCSIARTLALIGDRWTLLVLRDVANGVSRFDELASHLGIARNVLSRRLATLTGTGLLVRSAYREPGERERHEYRLSGAGRELVLVLLAFMNWGDRHLAGPEGPPAVARHADCGARVRITVTCEEGHELGDRPRLRLEPGPGSRVRSLPGPGEPGTVDLAGRGPGQRLTELHHVGHHVAGEPPPAVLQHVAAGQA